MLYRKIDGKFVGLMPNEENLVRQEIRPDASSGPLLYNDSGYDCVYSDEESNKIRAQWVLSETKQDAAETI